MPVAEVTSLRSCNFNWFHANNPEVLRVNMHTLHSLSYVD